MPSSHPLVQLARNAIQHHLDSGKKLVPPENIQSSFSKPTGAFVTLYQDGSLRGCIGSLKPQTQSLAEEVVRNAILAATKDPRYDPVSHSEIDGLTIRIEVVTPPEPVDDISNLDPKVDGLIVRSGKKQGVLLPGIEGIETVDQQEKICRSKGGIKNNENVAYSRFRVEQHI
ncbi:MAG: AmmeMemoRadiSam system protein A [Candidatus Nitronauta litoralis]|uniref:AmmeMemoRadiSam system protein A n=1 Tax=Candidatus Nitronauta litoralis TaxID=2705533 RepID=A0A7T0BXY4_9BACT|nr:MAG: AmmeMemoRadiSam system protein A [Candidatus Nitronauta litoralis]